MIGFVNMKNFDEELIGYLNDLNPAIKGVFMNPSEAVFEENVKMNCFYCGKYNNNWRCPPHLPKLSYEKLFSEYDKGLFVIFESKLFKQEDFSVVRRDSSVIVHKVLLELERWMWNRNRVTAISFGAGSCKLCKNGCGSLGCNNPQMSRSPLEATGCNVIKTARKYGIAINFPPRETLIRIGLLLWQS